VAASRKQRKRDGGRSGGAVDKRLLRYARATRTFMALSVGLGALTALLVLAQAWFLAQVVAGAFIEHKDLQQLRLPMALLLAAVAGRALTVWTTERAAHRASAQAKSELRTALVERIAQSGPAVLDEDKTGGLAVLATSGVDALDAYFARYSPRCSSP